MREVYRLFNPVPAIITWNGVVRHICATHRFSMCAWRLMHEKLSAHDNLKRRGWHMPSRCLLCMKDEETLDHLFVSYEISAWFWKVIVLNMDKQFLKDNIQ